MFKKTYSLPILFGFLAVIFVSCDKDYNELGADIVGDDHFYFSKYSEASVKAYNYKLGPVASNNLSVNPLGSYNNPVFGNTRANFVTQVEMDSPNPTFNNTDPSNYKDKPVIDSVILNIPYFSRVDKVIDPKVNSNTYKLDSIYGESESKFKLNVFRSNYFLRDLDPGESLGTKQSFYTDQDGEIDNNKIPGWLNVSSREGGIENDQFFFDKRQHKTIRVDVNGVKKDSTYAPPSMRLHLDITVFNDLILNAPSGKLASNAVFKEYFRGLYFKTENGNNMAMLNFKNGKVTMYYKEDEKQAGDTFIRSDTKTFVLNLTGNTISLLDNSNEKQDYLNAINPSQEASELSLIGGEGSIAAIDMFGPDTDNNNIADEIDAIRTKGWLINDASLTFYINKEKMTKSFEPNRVFLYDLTNKRVILDYVTDGSTYAKYPKFGKIVYGGILLDKDSKVIYKQKDSDGNKNVVGEKYTIKITNYVRDLVKNGSKNVRLGLSVTENINDVSFSKLKTANIYIDGAPSMSVANPLGTVLYGTNIPVGDINYDKRLKLEIYYTKPN